MPLSMMAYSLFHASIFDSSMRMMEMLDFNGWTLSVTG